MTRLRIARFGVLLWLGMAGPLIGESDPRETQLERARTLVKEKRYDDALPIVESVLANRPDDERALSIRAEIHRRSGQHDKAVADYERLGRLRPESAEVWFWIGTLERWRDSSEAAIRAFSRALELSRCHLDALKGRARARRHAGDEPGAEADLRAALDCRPRDAEATELLADVLRKRGDRRGGERLLREAFTGVELDRHLGDLALSAERPAEAAEHYQRGLQAGESASLLRRLGDAERARGRSAAALDAYRRAARLDPEDRGSRFWIGTLAGRSGRRDEALHAFDEMLALKAGDVSALVGKARLLRGEGRYEEALALLQQAIDLRPDGAEALILRAAILFSMGRSGEAQRDYKAVLGRDRGDSEARAGLDRLGATRAVDFAGRYGRTEAIEGLEEEGFEVNGRKIRPARIEYLGEGAEADLRWRLTDSTGIGADFQLKREAVTNLDSGRVFYDFDVVSAAAGLDHRPSERWRLSWRAGGVRYDPRREGTISSESRFRGSAQIEWLGRRSRLSATASRAPFIQRGFGADTTFRIFTQDRAALDWERSLGKGWGLEASAGLSHFDDGNTPVDFGAGVAWERSDHALRLSYRHDPITARFFQRDLRLQFIDYDAVSLSGRLSLPLGFRASADGRIARYGPTVRILEQDVDGDGILDRIAGPLARNLQRRLEAALAWSPRSFRPLSLGVDFFDDHYDFDTGPYNNLSRRYWAPFVEIDGEIRGRLSYGARYARGFISDERKDDYRFDAVSGHLKAKLGRIHRGAGSVTLGLEGQFRDNTLDERRERYRAFLTVPF